MWARPDCSLSWARHVVRTVERGGCLGGLILRARGGYRLVISLGRCGLISSRCALLIPRRPRPRAEITRNGVDMQGTV